MKVIKCKIEGTIYLPPKNEPWKSQRITIEKITKFYKVGFDYFFNSFAGVEATEGFFDEIPKDVETVVVFKERVQRDDYYSTSGNLNTFKCACLNRSKNNPYQLPRFTTL
jgi:hypothetical protein